MKVLGKGVLDDFKSKHTDVRSQVESWVAEVEVSTWELPMHIKQRYSQASFLASNQIVFNLKGNKYRLLVKVDYLTQIVLIKKAGTHEEYEKWIIR